MVEMGLSHSLRLGLTTGALAVLGFVIVTSPAAANVPPPVSNTNVIRVPALGNATDGALTTRVTYTDTTATATAFSGDTVGLNNGFNFRMRTCVAYHLAGTTPVARCAIRSVDTRGNSAPIYTNVPTIALTNQPRATTQPWGYFKGYTEILYQSGSAWPLIAHSWPRGGLADVGIAVAPQGQTSGVLPPNSTVTLDGSFTSAINSGQPDSFCVTDPIPYTGGDLPPGVTSSHPAFAGAPAYYEVGLPSGAHTGEAPTGIMLVVHGGGWSLVGKGGVEAERPDADRWRDRGWETVNVTYRPCGESLTDVQWFYDHARAWFGSGAVIGALGTSAGGHLALQLAATRPGVYGVVSQAGPTDLTTIQDEPVYNPATGQFDSTLGSRWVRNLGAAAFGEENLASYSPAQLALSPLSSTRVLQAFSADDGVVPYDQAVDLDTALRTANPAAYVDDLQLAVGTIPFAHGKVTAAALDDFYAHERALVAPVTAPTVALDRR
jgi:acetyl esterase/lipase